MISNEEQQFTRDSESNKKKEIVVPENQTDERIDQYLSDKLAKISRSQIQKLIKDGDVTVNDQTVKPSYSVSPGDQILVNIQPSKKTTLVPENIPIDVIFEDESLLVVNKRAGMVVHPAYGNLSGTLANALAHYSNNLSTLSGNYRPGLVHRLDKNTSGLLVVAKNDFVHAKLSEQFSAHTVQREYIAIVWGHFAQNKGEIETYLNRSAKDRTKIIVSEEGKYAKTNYQVVQKFHLVSLLRLNLETGRTHQIRVHLSSKGHPVLGDPDYGGRHKQTIKLNQEDRLFANQLLDLMPRQALHAKTLGFIHPTTRQQMMFDSKLPRDMQELITFIEEGTSSK